MVANDILCHQFILHCFYTCGISSTIFCEFINLLFSLSILLLLFDIFYFYPVMHTLYLSDVTLLYIYIYITSLFGHVFQWFFHLVEILDI